MYIPFYGMQYLRYCDICRNCGIYGVGGYWRLLAESEVLAVYEVFAVTAASAVLAVFGISADLMYWSIWGIYDIYGTGRSYCPLNCMLHQYPPVFTQSSKFRNT